MKTGRLDSGAPTPYGTDPPDGLDPSASGGSGRKPVGQISRQGVQTAAPAPEGNVTVRSYEQVGPVADTTGELVPPPLREWTAYV